MSKMLIIAEKPDVAAAFASVLGKKEKFQKHKTHFESKSYIVAFQVGHLLSAKNPSDYTSFKEKGWVWDNIPFYPPNGEMDYQFVAGKPVNQYKKALYDNFKIILKRPDVSCVVNGCDAGREGDLIFWELYDHYGCTKPVKRLWISSLNEEAVEKGFNSLRDESFYLPKREAAYARQYADWVLGHNLTIGFTIKAVNRTLHVGRVQTPTLALLVKRRLEIENFVPKDYFVVEAMFGNKYKGTWYKEQLSNTKFNKKEDAEAVVAKVTGHTAIVTHKDTKQEKVNPPSLFNLNDLQREGIKKFGYSSKQVLELAQILYEKYKFLSYPRSDSRHLETSQVSDLAPTLKAISVEPYTSFAETVITQGIKTSKHFVDDSKVTDHHAIIPTTKALDLATIKDEVDKNGRVIHSKEELTSIMDIVIRRFLAVFYPPALFEKTEVTTTVQEETFKTSGKVKVEEGWQAVYGKSKHEVSEDEKDEKDEKGLLPPIEKGEQNSVSEVNMLGKKTTPPKHYGEDELLAVMEDPRKLLEDEELKDSLKEAGAGLGTAATRADIIASLLRRDYVHKKGKSFIATDHAVRLIAIAPEELKSPEITADWEGKLSKLEQNAYSRDEFEAGIRHFVESNLSNLRTSPLTVEFPSDRSTVGKCPKCGKNVIEFPKGFACEGNAGDSTCFRAWKSMAKKTLTAKQVATILSKGEVGPLKGFTSASKKKFDAIVGVDDEKMSLTFRFPKRPDPVSIGVTCPTCGGEIHDHGNSYRCPSHTQETPCWMIWKEVSKKIIGVEAVKELVDCGETSLIKGFKSKANKPFDAILVKKGSSFEFKFPERAPKVREDTGIQCPACGGAVMQTDQAYGCENFRTCKFTVWKVMSGRTMTSKEVEQLSLHGKTAEKLKGFESKKKGSDNKKKTFDAFLVVDKKTGAVSFAFQ